MGTMAHAQVAMPAPPTSPPLQNGDMLSRAEFEKRWEMHPHIKKAELIDGQVYLEVTVSRKHGRPHSRILGWLAAYEASHSDEVEVVDNVTVRLPAQDDVQPDAAVRKLSGGSSTVSIDDCIDGPPELVCEIAASSASYDLHIKRDLYERAGVQEYLVWQVYENRIDWWQLVDGKYEALDLIDGVFESKVFPGLRLNAIAMLTGDMAAVLAEVAPAK
jgi:Uma2 family endonuclease